MAFTSSYMLSLVYLFLRCGPAQTDVSVRVSPYRSQYFQRESISLSCEEDDQSALGWTVKRNTSKINAACNTDWGATEGASCVIAFPYRWDSGVFWCETKSGKRSLSINITFSDVILESPVLPVTEGSDVTLRCLSKDQTTDKPSSDLPAGFYLNGSLFRTESTGQMTIHHVNKSDEGFYKCSISGRGESPESWMEVTKSSASPSPSSSSSPPTSYTPPPTPESAEPPLITLNQLIIKLLVFTPYVISTFLYFSILRDRARARAAAANARRRNVNDVIMEVAV